jgi:hypothetical protein
MRVACACVVQAIRFFHSKIEDARALWGERPFNTGRYVLVDFYRRFDLLPAGLDRPVFMQQPIRQRPVLAKPAKQEMFSFEVRTPVPARLVTREENPSAGFLRESLKHEVFLRTLLYLLNLSELGLSVSRTHHLGGHFHDEAARGEAFGFQHEAVHGAGHDE